MFHLNRNIQGDLGVWCTAALEITSLGYPALPGMIQMSF